MLKTLQVKLLPSDEQRGTLADTFEKFNGACNYVSKIAWERHLFNKMLLQKVVYRDIRSQFKLPAQLAIRVIAKVAETYKADRDRFHEFKEYGSIVYDRRIMSFKGLDIVSLNTVHGRIKVPITVGGYTKIPFERMRGECDLVMKNGKFYLMAAVEVPEGPPMEVRDVIGVDMGIVNIAVDSTGKYYSGDKVKEVRERYSALRSRLQSVGTKSAKRHLKKLSGKESRFVRNTNHVISKEIVQTAKGTSSAIAVENLSGIRKRTTVRKAERYMHNSWAFHQLRSFIEYKAREAGVPVIVVDPKNTSIECPLCHTVDKRNRPERSRFKCVSCGLEGEADYISSLNIRDRAVANQPIVAGYDLSPAASQRASAVGS